MYVDETPYRAQQERDIFACQAHNNPKVFKVLFATSLSPASDVDRHQDDIRHSGGHLVHCNYYRIHLYTSRIPVTFAVMICSSSLPGRSAIPVPRSALRLVP